MKLQIQAIYNHDIIDKYNKYLPEHTFKNQVKRDFSFKLVDKIQELIEMTEHLQFEDDYPDGIMFRMEFVIIPDYAKFMQSIKDLKRIFEDTNNESGLYALKLIYKELIQ